MRTKKMLSFPKDLIQDCFLDNWSPIPIKSIWEKNMKHIKEDPKFGVFFDKHHQNIDLIPVDSLMGIEVEVENIKSLKLKDYASYFGWKVCTDGSLRDNGVEFVSSALTHTQCRDALALLWSSFDLQEEPVVFDWRSSFHVHMNMRNKDTEFLIKLLLLYSIFESSFFDLAGSERKRSNFCIPLNSTSLHSYISSFIRKEISLRRLVEKWTKYSALNICSLSSYGTIEFRQLEGTNDLSRISNWMNLIFSLFNYAEKTTVLELYEDMSSLNTTSLYEEFKFRVFDKKSFLLSSPESHKEMREGILFSKLCISSNPKLKTDQESTYKRMINAKHKKKIEDEYKSFLVYELNGAKKNYSK